MYGSSTNGDDDLAVTTRADRERAHGARLSRDEPDRVWGWATPAGERRATRRAALLAEAAGLGPGVTALEIGCGTGLFTQCFAATGADLTAVDVSDDLLQHARGRELAKVRFVLGDFLEADPGGPFDAVIGSSILHHLPVAPALTRVAALLKPGGRLAFAEPNLLNPQVFLERRLRFLSYYAAYTSPDETAFVRWWLARRLRDAGFEDIQIAPHDWLHPATPVSLLAPVAMLGAFVERVPLLREFAGSVLITARKP